MSRKLAIPMTVAAVCLLGGPSADAQRPGGNPRQQFTVVASGENVILLDQREGRTWLLTHSPAGGTPAWVPIQQINSPEEAEHWREEQHTLAQQRQREHQEQRQREMTERLEERRREMEQRRKEFEQQAHRGRDARQGERDESGTNPLSETQEPEGPGVREHLQRLGEQTQRAMLESLQQHRKRMIEQFGEEHPAVKSIGEQIERLRRELEEAPESPHPPAEQGDNASPPLQKKADPQTSGDISRRFAATVREAYSLLVEELKTLEKVGRDQLRAKELRGKIEVLERVLKQLDGRERKEPAAPEKEQTSPLDSEADPQDEPAVQVETPDNPEPSAEQPAEDQ